MYYGLFGQVVGGVVQIRAPFRLLSMPFGCRPRTRRYSVHLPDRGCFGSAAQVVWVGSAEHSVPSTPCSKSILYEQQGVLVSGISSLAGLQLCVRPEPFSLVCCCMQ